MAPLQALALFLLPGLLATATTTTVAAAASSTAFIKSTCDGTTYPSLCYDTCLPYASRVEAGDLKALSLYALQAALSAARSAARDVSRLSSQPGLDALDVAAIKQCVEENKDGIAELKDSLAQMADMNRGDFKLKVENVKTWTSAAITDEDTCMDGMGEHSVSPTVKNKIRGCILNVAKVTSNALSMINRIQ